MADNRHEETPETLRRELIALLEDFEQELRSDELRKKVLALVPCFYKFRSLGKALIPKEIAASARARILHYFLKYPFVVIKGDELLVVSGIQEYARRVRELRVQFGWTILSGVTAKQMAEEDDFFSDTLDPFSMAPDDYALLNEKPDRDAAYRWNIANEIRKQHLAVKTKILAFLRKNVGSPVTGEELRYVADDKTEWPRRVRELRTEEGWPILTRNTGRPDLLVGVYLLEADRQSPKHDRNIKDAVRRAVLRRDGYKCAKCGWSHVLWNRSDPRHLEIHHIKHHSKGGENEEPNLVTVCTVCHDIFHSKS